MTQNNVLKVTHSVTQNILQGFQNVRDADFNFLATRQFISNPLLLQYTVVILSNPCLKARDDDNSITEGVVVVVDKVAVVEGIDEVERGFTHKC